MARGPVSMRFVTAATLLMFLAFAPTADAQVVRAPLTEGFARTSSISMSVDEMLGTRKTRSLDEPLLGPGYPSLYIAEVQYKPMRLIRMELPNPTTGKVEKELIRYMVYRVIRRDYTELAGKDKAELEKKLFDPERAPANALDPETPIPLQMPRFLLETEDKNGTVIGSYRDEINIEIQNAVFAREMGRKSGDFKLLNSVEAISEVGPPVAVDDKDTLLKALYGVAVWRNVDPKPDFLSVTMSGFSNAYRISGDASNRLVEEKVIVQKFARPGDEYLQDETELRFLDDADTDGDGKVDTRYPLWKYRAKPVDLKVKDLDTILRNASAEPVAPVEN